MQAEIRSTPSIVRWYRYRQRYIHKRSVTDLVAVSYTEKLKKPDNQTEADIFANAREKLAYVVFDSRPDIEFDVDQLSQVSSDKVNNSDIAKMNRVVDDIKKDIPLTYLRLDKDSISVVGYEDAGF